MVAQGEFWLEDSLRDYGFYLDCILLSNCNVIQLFGGCTIPLTGMDTRQQDNRER